jgi:hypothetical protein
VLYSTGQCAILLPPLQTATEEQEQREGYEEQGWLSGNGNYTDGSQTEKV